MSVSAKKLMRTKSKKDEQTLQELNLAHRHSQAKCQLVQTSYIKRILKIVLVFARTKSVFMGES